MNTSKLGSRYAPPRMQEGELLARPQLAQALAQGAGCITLLCAPPGSGKTTALVQRYQALSAQQQPVLWLSLTPQDNQLPTLRQHLGLAFLDDAHAALEEALLPPQLHAFVDGLEQLTEPAARALAVQWLLTIPDSSSVYTTAHYLQDMALHDARLRGLLRVVDASQLRLSTAEAAELLGDAWPPELAHQANQRMQGWAAGLRLLRPNPQAARQWLNDSIGKQLLPSALADYFEELVCALLPAQTLQTMMELSTFERFRSELFADMPEAPCEWPLIEQLLRGGWFLQQSHDAPEWLHFHPALGQYLRQRLQRQAPERYKALRHFAASWNAAQGFAEEAVRHATQLHTAQAPHIIEQAGAITVDLGEGPDVMLEPTLAPERAAELPLVILGQIYYRFRQGRVLEARQLFDAASTHTQHFTRIANPSLRDEVRGWHCLMHVVMLSTADRPIDAQQITLLEDEYHAQAARNPVLAASLASVLAFNWLNEGLFSKVASICTMGLCLHPADSAVKARLFLRLHQSSAALANSSLEKAQAYLQDGLQLASKECSPQSYEMHTLQLQLALLHFERNDCAAAQRLLEAALPNMHAVFGWSLLYAEVFAMAVQLASMRGDTTAVERLQQEAQHLAHERQLPRLLDMLHIIRLRTLTQASAWPEALALLESPAFQSILHPCCDTAFPHSTHIPALLAAAQLHMDLGRASSALHWLEQLPSHWMHTTGQRLHFHFHVLHMRVAYSLRRYKAAAEHWQSAVHLARIAGLLRLAHQERQHLTHLMHTLPRTRRSPLPAPLQHWLQQVLTPPNSNEAELQWPPSAPRSSAHNDQPQLLSPRESEILNLLEQGCINKEIAKQLGISEGTVKTHRKHIHEKLGVSSRSQAIQKAREWMLI